MLCSGSTRRRVRTTIGLPELPHQVVHVFELPGAGHRRSASASRTPGSATREGLGEIFVGWLWAYLLSRCGTKLLLPAWAVSRCWM